MIDLLFFIHAQMALFLSYLFNENITADHIFYFYTMSAIYFSCLCFWFMGFTLLFAVTMSYWGRGQYIGFVIVGFFLGEFLFVTVAYLNNTLGG